MSLLITLLIYVLIFGAIWYVLGLVPLPPPLRVISQVILALMVLVVLINFLTGGSPGLPALR